MKLTIEDKANDWVASESVRGSYDEGWDRWVEWGGANDQAVLPFGKKFLVVTQKKTTETIFWAIGEQLHSCTHVAI